MGRKSDIRSEISYQEGKISEYNNCIKDLRNVESSIRNKLTYFETEVYDTVKAFSTSGEDFRLGNKADDTTAQKNGHSSDVFNLTTDAESMIQDIIVAINKYDDMITNCRHKISSLNSELDAILEAERRAAQQYIL